MEVEVEVKVTFAEVEFVAVGVGVVEVVDVTAGLEDEVIICSASIVEDVETSGVEEVELVWAASANLLLISVGALVMSFVVNEELSVRISIASV